MHDANRAIEGDSIFVFVLAGWAIWYGVWLLVIKPRSSELMVGLQAAAGLGLGLTSLMLYAERLPEIAVVVLAFIVGAASFRHFLSSYEETYITPISLIVGFFVAQLTWLLGRWLTVYELANDVVRIPQLTLICLVFTYMIAELYHQSAHKKLTKKMRRRILGVGTAVLFVVVVASDWTQSI